MSNLRQIRHPHPGLQEEQLLRKKIPFVVVLHQQLGSCTESMRVNMLPVSLKEQNRPSPEMAVASRGTPYESISFHNVFRQALQSAQSSSHQRHSLSQRKMCHASGWYNLMAVATQSVGPVSLPLNQVRHGLKEQNRLNRKANFGEEQPTSQSCLFHERMFLLCGN